LEKEIVFGRIKMVKKILVCLLFFGLCFFAYYVTENDQYSAKKRRIIELEEQVTKMNIQIAQLSEEQKELKEQLSVTQNTEEISSNAAD